MRTASTRFLPGLILLAGALSLPAGAAHAQDEGWGEGDDGFVFEPEETGGFVFEPEQVGAVPVSPSAPVARYLQDGMAAYDREDFLAASGFFWRVVQEQDVSADSIRPRAQFELAKTLVRMRLLQGALFFFDEIILTGPSHPFFEASAEWLIVIARRLPGDSEMLRRIHAFAPLFPDRVEEKYRDEMAWYLGQHAFNVGERERALQYLSLVTPVSTFHPEAVFLQGITHVRLGENRQAVEVFERLLDMTRRGGQDRRLHELARLSLARTYYGLGNYPRAVEYYEAVPRASDAWLDSLFESSWAYYQLEQFNRALGNLHSLNSPFFNDQFYPEGAVLQAVIQFYSCRWTEVKATLEEYDFVYGPLLEDLRARMGELEDELAYFQFLRDLTTRTERRFNPRLQQVVNLTLNDRSIRNASAFIEELDRELNLIATSDPGWARSELGEYLRGETLATRDLAMIDAGVLVRNRLQSLADELAQHDRSMRGIQVETELAEAGVISANLAEELYRGEGQQATQVDRSEYMTWSFDGEYWRDELGYYYYQLRSRCQ
jgi:tetratricopeptide (TPR) repeat protein